MSERTPVSHPIYGLLHMDVDGFDSLAELALDMRWSWNHRTDEGWRQLDPVLWELMDNNSGQLPITQLRQVNGEWLRMEIALHILGSGRRCFLVNRGDDTVGLMTLHQIKKVPRPEWATTRAAQVMLPLEQLKSINPDTELWAALQKMDSDGANQLPVTLDHHVIGILSREDVITFLRTLQELGT